MRSLRILYSFYIRLIVPTIIIALGLGGLGLAFTGKFSFVNTGLAFIFLIPLFHYFLYEIRHPNTYYFYYNLGYAKLYLWILSVVLSCSVGLILMSI